MKKCKLCYMPDTRPNTPFKDGICQACLNYKERNMVDWNNRESELKALCDKYRKDDGSYDCIIPLWLSLCFCSKYTSSIYLNIYEAKRR